MKDANYCECRYYNSAGFNPPIDNRPSLNSENAGRLIPVKFSLGGNWGLNMFAVGYPKSEVIACDSTDSVNGTGAIVMNAPLTYDPSSDQYQFNWKTNKLPLHHKKQLKVIYQTLIALP